ncbi:MAG: glycosyltransferase family 2 protein [Methanosarcina sp.]
MDNISIVVPLLNKGPHVERVLNSVLRQTVLNFEVIVIDGGSSDDGPAIIETFANKDSRIRLIQQKNKGVSDARNQGISESKFKLIAFLDADDEWMPDYLETILRLWEKYPDAGLYATSIKTDFIDNVLMGINVESRKTIPDEGLVPNYFKIYKNGDYLFGTSSVTIPAQIFSEIGGFQTDFWWGEDTDMWCKDCLKTSGCLQQPGMRYLLSKCR